MAGRIPVPLRFLSEFQKALEIELAETDRECFRRRNFMLDFLGRIKSEQEVAGLT